MNSTQSDEELGRACRSKAASLGYSPDAFLNVAEAFIIHQRWSTMPNFPPFPQIELEVTLGPEHLAAWPEWTAKLIDAGCRIQQMTWPDGTVTTRLVSRQRAVLAAEIERPVSPKSSS